MTAPAQATRNGPAELAAILRPSLTRLTRLMRIQRADMSVTLTQLSAMVALEKHGAMSPGELAAYERVQPPSMTKVLANLEERGLVRRTVHPTDRRQAVIEISDIGRELIDSERRSRDLWFIAQLETLNADEQALMRRVVPVLDKLAGL
jgi:DNA-binding MarR family transcriptional regulator